MIGKNVNKKEMIEPPIIGIDPGVSAGCISVLENGVIKCFRMKESLEDIRNILKPYASHPTDKRIKCSIEALSSRPMQNPFMNKRMEPLYRNCSRIKDALMDLNICFKEVAPVTWQNFHNLTLPRGVGEKGVDYDRLKFLKTNTKQVQSHLYIERESDNKVILSDDVVHVLKVSGSLQARKTLGDDYWHFDTHSLRKALKELDSEYSQIKSKETQTRKKRYQKKAEKLFEMKMPQWQADANLILAWHKYNS